VGISLGGETVRSLNQKRVADLSRKLPTLRAHSDVSSFQDQTGQQLGRLLNQDRPLRKQGGLKIRAYGQIARSGYHIEKLTYESEPGILIPGILLIPEEHKGKNPAVVYADGRGKSAEAGPRRDLEQLAKAGYVMIAS